MENDLLKTQLFAEFEVEKLKQKEEEVRMSLLINPNDFELLRELAIILYHKNDYASAIKVYKKVLEYKENKVEGYAFLGQLYYENEEYKKAIEMFEKALDINPDFAFGHFLLGNAYSRAGDIMNAITSYDFAIFLDLDIYKAHLDFAEKYEKMGAYERAVREYRLAYDIDPREKSVREKIKDLEGKIRRTDDL
ncbi:MULTISPECIES: tetratricopeptide repeat protein [unclassified Fusobacterium]|uniref:tetratricopeptide repeat protein n=1 Tax=Fusobacterium sp. TaxID=68766 RepID=UPI0025B8C5F5|nr:tetratricopeptide repeat protein [Fusobacterium sp.]